MKATLLFLCTAIILSTGSSVADSVPISTGQTMPSGAKADTLARPGSSDTTRSDSGAISIATKSIDTLSYEADRIGYDMSGKVLTLRGHAMAKYQDVTLYADSIVYLIDQSLFIAEGAPRLIQNGDVTVGESMTYNTKTKRGQVHYATSRQGQDYFNGEKIIKTAESELYIKDGDYTSCAYPHDPHYFFYGHNLKILPGDKAITRPVVLNIGDAPVFTFPFFMLPLNKGKRSGFLMPTWGGNPSSGGYLDNVGYYWAINDYMDAKIASRVYEFSDFLVTATSQYAKLYTLSGNISASYALGSGNKYNSYYSPSSSSLAPSSSRWSLDYSHSQQLTPDASATLSGRGSLSTESYIKTYSQDTAKLLSQNLNANLTLSKRFEAIKASALLTINRQNNLQSRTITDDLPSMSFSLPSRPLIPEKSRTDDINPNGAQGSSPQEAVSDEKQIPWYNKITYSYNANGTIKHYKYADTLQHTTKENYRSGAGQSLNVNAPQQLFKWFTLTPSINTTVAVFNDYIDTVRSDTTIIDTVSYVSTNRSLDNLYRNYTPLDTIPVYTLDSLAQPDTQFTIRKIAKPRTLATYDTISNSFNYDADWNTSIGLSTTLYGLFPLRILNFTGIRHTFSPTLSYTFTPKHEQDRRFVDIGVRYEQGRKKQAQSVGIGVSNLFQGKTINTAKTAAEKPAENKFTILDAGFGTAYNFEGEKRKWSDLSLNAGTSFEVLRVQYNSSFWFYDELDIISTPILSNYSLTFSPNAFTASGTFWDGDLLTLYKVQPKDSVEYQKPSGAWQMDLSPSYSYRVSRAKPSAPFITTKNYTLGASAKLDFTRNWSLSWSSSYDFVVNNFTNHTMAINCDLECWDLHFDWRPSGINPGFNFKVNIKKIPEIKWERNS